MEAPTAAGRKPPAGRGGLLALATAAVVAVYAAGYTRTEVAAERFARDDSGRGGPPERNAQPSSSGQADPALPKDETPSQPASATAPLAASAEASGAGIPAVPAPAPVPAAAAASVPAGPAASAGAYQDGIYTGWGTSQHGRIEATVEVQGGRIVDAKISTCRMRWPCARIAFLVPQPVERQGTDIDVITRVTDSSDAFYYALVEALSKAK